jgi:ankyrin repeat protein
MTEKEFVVETPAEPTGDIGVDTLKLLIEANPSALTYNVRRSALTLLCEGCCVSLELMKILIDDDGVVLSVNGRDSSMWALLYNNTASSFPADVFRYLFHHDSSALMCAEQNTNADWSFDDIDNMSCLQVACGNKNMKAEIVELLIDLKPEMVQHMDRFNGFPPLHAVCANRSTDEQSAIDIMKLLVAKYPKALKKVVGEDLTTTWTLSLSDTLGKRPINLAKNEMGFNFIKALLAEYISVSIIPKANILQMACRYRCSLEIVKKLVNDTQDLIMMEDGEHHVARHTAVKYASPEIVKYLIDEHENALFKQDGLMEIPLHKACRQRRLDIIELLLTKNVDQLSIKDQSGCIPLHTAIKHANLDIVRCLVEADESTLVKSDKRMEVALHKACRAGKFDVVEYLMNKNMATVTIKNLRNELPVHLLCTLSENESESKSFGKTTGIYSLLKAYPETMLV